MTPREEAEKIFGSLRGSLIGKPLDEAIIDLLAHTLQSRNEQLKAAREEIESLVNIEGIADCPAHTHLQNESESLRSVQWPSEDEIINASTDYCDGIHASRGPLPVMTAKELEDTFEAGVNWLKQRMAK